MTEKVSITSARRIALAAQGFGREVRAGIGTRQLTGTLDRLGVLQIDSVNVWERSHYLPVFARLGSYDKSLLDAITLAPRARYLEYWGHEATFMRREMLPLFQWRMDRYRDRALADADGWVRENRATLDWLLAEIGRGGPRAASDIEHEDNVRQGPWWGWSDVKRGLEVLFRSGELVSAGRKGFERRYALPAQVLPAEITSRVVAKPDAIRELVAHAARAHGIGTLDDIADYFRLPSAETREAIRDLVDSCELLPVSVEGWSQSRPAALRLPLPHRDLHTRAETGPRLLRATRADRRRDRRPRRPEERPAEQNAARAIGVARAIRTARGGRETRRVAPTRRRVAGTRTDLGARPRNAQRGSARRPRRRAHPLKRLCRVTDGEKCP